VEDAEVRHETRPTVLPADLLDQLRERADTSDSALLEDFARAMLRRIPPAQIEAGGPAWMADAVLRAFRLLRTRHPDERKIAVHEIDDPETDVGTVLLVVTTDRPFLLSSVNAEIADQDLDVVRSIHPIIGTVRDDDGRLVAIRPVREVTERESLIHVELRPQLTEEEQGHLEERIRLVIDDVLAATSDYLPMRERVAELLDSVRAAPAEPEERTESIPEANPDEVAEFIEWVLQNNFLLIGCRDYALRETEEGPVVEVEHGSGYGILADTTTSAYADPVPLADADEGLRERQQSPALISVARSHRTSTVDQRVRMLNIWVARHSPTGERLGERRILGIFTRRAQAERSTTIPILRRKFSRLIEREDILPDTHDERTYTALFEAMPPEELFELDVNELQAAIAGLVAAEEERDIRVLCHVDSITRTASIIASIPRDRYGPELRRAVQDLLLDWFNGTSVDVDLSLGDRPDAVVRFAVHVPEGPIGAPPAEELEAAIRKLARTWLDGLEAALVKRHERSMADRLAREFGDRLPPSYRENTPIEDALLDVELLDELVHSGDQLRVVLRETERHPPTRVKILKRGTGVELSTVMPILESLGLTVVEELPFRLLEGGPQLHVHDYGVRTADTPIDVETDGSRIAAATVASWDGLLETDSLNRLVASAGLDWSMVAILRAYRRLRRQLGTAYTADYQNAALATNPDAVRALVEMFEVRFDPDREATEIEVRAASDRALAAIDAVQRLDEDRILRDFHALIAATLRTNRYIDPAPDALALKIDSSRVPNVDRPIPYREVFVYSPTVEGIHLRGAPVARGGIRWSDRRDDFRSEVLDLMQAQMLKNALIVPDGAKGAFVVKHPDVQPDPVGAYTTYIRALLQITDNVVAGEIVGPDRVRRLDGGDPYLVVAADRGTATFSDLANEIAHEHEFWLGDAFASGGSEGYDHKKLGITARGAWVAVERHLRELGIDANRDPVTVAGIGDMSGDVFGNGLIRSRTTRLVAAFDHRDIFIDPTPDPERSFEERRRLFDMPRSSWQDYDRALISAGGGVWSRGDKAIPVSKEVARLLRVEADVLSPPELIRAILRAPVDLLFAGGIGTFVKASSEEPGAIGDRTNAEIRVDASELRCRVVGEGANLALTQRARVQYARRGGRVNTDFVDNAAGVDISDREVNLKILLRGAIEGGLIEESERVELLRAVSDEVVTACLEDVDRQTWTLFEEAEASPRTMEVYETLIARLEHDEALDRQVESLPTSEEMRDRAEAGAGLSRPELAVVLAATKRDLARELTASWLVDAPALQPLLHGYFPDLLIDRCGATVDEHHLRRDLIGTRLANEIVDRAGVTFTHRLARELGISQAEVAAAYWIARQIADATRFSETIARLDRELGPETALMAKKQLDTLLETLTREYARSADLRSPETVIAADSPAFADVETLLAGSTRRSREMTSHAERLVDAGVEPETAVVLAGLRDLGIAPHVAEISRSTTRAPSGVAAAFLQLDEALGVSRIRRLLETARPTDRWERWHTAGLIDDLRDLHRTAVESALSEQSTLSEIEAVDRYLGRRDAALRHASQLLRQVEEEADGRRLEAVAVVVRATRIAVLGPRGG
jgi:glutamate dehydrogenase